MFNSFVRQALSTKNNLVPAVVLPVISTPLAECRLTGACNDKLLCEVELSIPITNTEPGDYITISTQTPGGASVTIINSSASNARIEFSNNGSNTNFIAFNVEVRDSGGTLKTTSTYGLANSSSQTQLEWSNLPTCAAPPFLIYNPISLFTNYTAETLVLSITSNVSWTVAESPAVDWMTLIVTSGGTGGLSGFGNGTVNVGIQQNPIGNNGRIGYVRITSIVGLENISVEQTCNDSSGPCDNP